MDDSNIAANEKMVAVSVKGGKFGLKWERLNARVRIIKESVEVCSIRVHSYIELRGVSSFYFSAKFKDPEYAYCAEMGRAEALNVEGLIRTIDGWYEDCWVLEGNEGNFN